jgi:hypothetical protein
MELLCLPACLPLKLWLVIASIGMGVCLSCFAVDLTVDQRSAGQDQGAEEHPEL